jgi:hypothetical protein
MREGSGQGLCDVGCLGRSGKQFNASRESHTRTTVHQRSRWCLPCRSTGCWSRRAGGLWLTVRLRGCVDSVLRGPQKDVFLHSGLAAGGAGFQTIRYGRQANIGRFALYVVTALNSQRFMYSTRNSLPHSPPPSVSAAIRAFDLEGGGCAGCVARHCAALSWTGQNWTGLDWTWAVRDWKRRRRSSAAGRLGRVFSTWPAARARVSPAHAIPIIPSHLDKAASLQPPAFFSPSLPFPPLPSPSLSFSPSPLQTVLSFCSCPSSTGNEDTALPCGASLWPVFTSS